MPTQVHYSAATIWTNEVAGVWPTLNANGNSGNIDCLPYGRLGLQIAPVGTPTGTTPTITFTVSGVDGQGNLFPLLTSAAIGTPFTPVLMSVGTGFSTVANLAAGIFVPRFVQVSWVLGGTTPTFPNIQVTLQGR